MKILKYLLFLFLIVLIGFSIYVSTLPGSFHVKRSRFINAPRSVVHEYLDNYHLWQDWSPWLQQEQEATLEFSANTSGEGAFYRWSGKDLGEGSMTTLLSRPDTIAQRIDFIKPYESSSTVYWSLDQQKLGTGVTWGMQGNMGFMEKAYLALQGKSMEEMIGPDYEEGLLNLDNTINDAMAVYSLEFPGVTNYGGGYTLYQTNGCSIEEVESRLYTMLEELHSYFERENISTAGDPLIRIELWDKENDQAVFSVHLPVKDQVIPQSGSTILPGFTTPGTYFKTVLNGDTRNLPEAWEKAAFAIEEQGLERNFEIPPFEVLVKGRNATENPALWVTELYIPLNPSSR